MINDVFLSFVGGGFPCLAAAPLNVGVFDGAVVLILMLGVWQGRKHGMSRELLPLIQWAATAAVGAALYRPVGDYLGSLTGFDRLWSYLSAYLLCMIAVSFIMGYVKRAIGEKMSEKETFGGMEYYLGMISGPIRCSCVVIVILAIIHAPYYTDAEVAAKKKAQIKELGSEFFPSLGEIQRYIFRDSFVGSAMEQYTPFLLVESTSTSGAAVPNASAKERQQKESDNLPIK